MWGEGEDTEELLCFVLSDGRKMFGSKGETEGWGTEGLVGRPLREARWE